MEDTGMKKKMFSFAARAAVAMLLLSAVSACTKDKTPEPSEVGGCYVTVSAGFPATKTEAAENDGVYSLKFTEGDRLYVHGTGVNMKEEGDWHMAGYLALTPNSITNDGKRAKFAGTLQLYKYDGTVFLRAETNTQVLGLSLKDCQGDVSVCLIPAGATEDLLSDVQINEQNQLTSIDVYVKDAVVQAKDMGLDPLPSLMSSAVDVRGEYDKDKNCIILNQSDDAIFNVSVSGLEYGIEHYELSLELNNTIYPLAGKIYPSSTTLFAFSVGIVGQGGNAKIELLGQGPGGKKSYLLTKYSQIFEKKIYKIHHEVLNE